MSAAVGGDTKNSLNNLGVGVNKVYAPKFEGLTDGQTAKTQAPGGQGTMNDVYWQWDASSKKWNGISKQQYDEAQSIVTVGASLGNLGGPGTIPAEGSGSLRYPSKDIKIDGESHYALFQFFDYAPPFSKRNINEVAKQLAPESVGAQGPTVPGVDPNKAKGYDYNQADQYTPAGEKYKTILMYMPEDISTGFKANWGGKAVSNIGAGALRAAGAEGFQKIKNTGQLISEASERLFTLGGAAALRKTIQSITGDTLTNNDIFGGISGAILNPNTELLFDSVDMRNFTLNFKMVPRFADEADTINEICKIFKACMLPTKDPGKVFGAENQGIKSGFIGVPKLCKVHFMVGGTENKYLPKFKFCAITEVNVSMTPDGVYATYNNDAPVATSLSVSFQETKLVYADEILNNSIR
tara:strand:+ start:722 stop:1954 length:1233 start_codon:yes stop_codon:yes gene_type:complete